MERKIKWTVIAFVVTSICLLVSLILIDPSVWLIVYGQTTLRPGTKVYQQWVQPTIPIYTQFYFFNLTNPREFLDGRKPRMQVIGPYTYREFRVKKEIVEHIILKTTRYKEFKQYHFVQHLSVGQESDVFTTVSLGYISIDERFGFLPSIVDRVIQFLEDRVDEHLITHPTIKEILWGYEDPFLALLKKVKIPVPDTRIGLYLNKNNSNDGVVEIYASNRNNDFGHIYRYHGMEMLSCWTTKQANSINGSDGSLFPPFMKSHEDLYVFSADICRSIQLKPEKMETIHGVPVMKYLPDEATLRSPLSVDKNKGFCINWPNCLKDGVIDMSTCIKGAPIIMSLPHLKYADPMYQNAVLGLNPTDESNTTFHIELKTGILFKASKQLQINAIVKNNPKFRDLSKVTNVYLPIMYLNESVNIDESLSSSIRSAFYLGPLVTKVVFSIVVMLLIVSLIILIIYVLVRSRSSGVNRDEYEPIINSSPPHS